MAMWSMFNDTLLADYGFQNFGVNGVIFGYQMVIRCNTYRGIYLSCIEDLDVTVDGKPVEKDKMRLCLNGKRYMMHQIPELYNEYWYKQKDGILLVYDWGGLKPGEHEITVRMNTRVPFTGYFGSYMMDDSHVTKTLTISEKE